MACVAARDHQEREADELANRVLHEPSLGQRVARREPGSSLGGESGPLVAPPHVHKALGGSAERLDPATSSFFESRFGHDFSGVRVYTDRSAGESARALGALAYTTGRHIVFGDRQYAPTTPSGRSLLAHELAHVVRQRTSQDPAGMILRKDDPKAAPKPTPQPKELALGDRKAECEDEVDCTAELTAFIAGFSARVQGMTDLNDEQRRGFKQMASLIFGKEGNVDPSTWKIVSCSKINLDVGRPGETFSAFFDPSNKKMGLNKEQAKLLSAPVVTKEDLAGLLESIAHEKRHATLGSALKVGAAGIRPDKSPSLAANAGYRAEEILTTAEEIAVGRMALGSEYVAERSAQEKLYRTRNMMRGWVTEGEYTRLRQLIIDKLRERYGFDDGCDNPLTVGVVRSMEKNEWFTCDRANQTIYGAVPEGLKVCTDDKHSFCKEKRGG